jgi:hypothetical protein
MALQNVQALCKQTSVAVAVVVLEIGCCCAKIKGILG